jgi:hypothetical protein
VSQGVRQFRRRAELGTAGYPLAEIFLDRDSGATGLAGLCAQGFDALERVHVCLTMVIQSVRGKSENKIRSPFKMEEARNIDRTEGSAPMKDQITNVDLTQLANKYGSDKGDVVGHAHNYAKLYEFLFDSWGDDVFSMLELGLQRGDVQASLAGVAERRVTDVPSARMWTEYFPRARVYGFDISDFSTFALDRFNFIRGDVGSAKDLGALSMSLPTLRLINRRRITCCLSPAACVFKIVPPAGKWWLLHHRGSARRSSDGRSAAGMPKNH